IDFQSLPQSSREMVFTILDDFSPQNLRQVNKTVRDNVEVLILNTRKSTVNLLRLYGTNDNDEQIRQRIQVKSARIY
ncbi:hypothetical protein PMAYCL1PPCAC_26960, partial [Pristionchus mayeri]